MQTKTKKTVKLSAEDLVGVTGGSGNGQGNAFGLAHGNGPFGPQSQSSSAILEPVDPP